MHPPVNRLVECALPVMRDFAANADQSCHLVVREGQNVLVVLQIDSPLPMRYSVALGSHFPILETSSGAVLLAHPSRADRDAIVERIVAAGEGLGTRAEIDVRLDEAQKRGHEMRPSLAVDGCINISMPVRDHTGARDRRTYRPVPAAEGRPLRSSDRVSSAPPGGAEKISAGAGRRRRVSLRHDCNPGRRVHRPMTEPYW